MKTKKVPDVYEARRVGKDFCTTEGARHYVRNGAEPLDLTISSGQAEGFIIGSILKYAGRYHITRKLDDLVKIADYAQILVGVKILGQINRKED